MWATNFRHGAQRYIGNVPLSASESGVYNSFTKYSLAETHIRP